MANWKKKMAEAFGRALGRPDEEMNDAIRSVIKELTQRGFTENDILNSLRSLGGR